jgi:Family of unknown function (DUF6153)
MSARRLWVLLLLAAVFSMHGVQCVAADVDSGHGMTGTAHALVAAPVEVSSVGVGLAIASSVAHGMAPGSVVVTETTGDGLPAHGTAFWAVCLAIVLAGVVLLGVVALIRTPWARAVRARAPSRLWRAGWSRLPRPPDLSALCLLRI